MPQETETIVEPQKLRANGTTNIDWKYAHTLVDIDNIDDFVLLTNRRDIRHSNVNKLYRLLAIGQHFETPLVCNKIGKKQRLIDGNHRIESVKKFLAEYPQRKVELGICFYENLTEEEERKKYTTWNLGTKQNTNDFIRQYWDVMPITKKLNKPWFPCNVRHIWATGAIEFKQLISPYLARNTLTQIVYRNPAIEFIRHAQDLTISDANVLKEFMREFILMYGEPDKKNMMYTPMTFSVIENIWLKNCERMPPDKLMKKLLKLRGHEKVIYWNTNSAGHITLDLCKRDFMAVLNAGATIEENMLVP